MIMCAINSINHDTIYITVTITVLAAMVLLSIYIIIVVKEHSAPVSLLWIVH